MTSPRRSDAVTQQAESARRRMPGTQFGKGFRFGEGSSGAVLVAGAGRDYTSASFRSSHTGMPSPVQIRRSVFKVRLISPRSSAL